MSDYQPVPLTTFVERGEDEMRTSGQSGADNTDEYRSLGFRVAAAVAPIPEPTSIAVWSLLGLAGIGAGWWRRRRKA